jgi:hypothetical protein
MPTCPAHVDAAMAQSVRKFNPDSPIAWQLKASLIYDCCPWPASTCQVACMNGAHVLLFSHTSTHPATLQTPCTGLGPSHGRQHNTDYVPDCETHDLAMAFKQQRLLDMCLATSRMFTCLARSVLLLAAVRFQAEARQPCQSKALASSAAPPYCQAAELAVLGAHGTSHPIVISDSDMDDDDDDACPGRQQALPLHQVRGLMAAASAITDKNGTPFPCCGP